jgi:hypothetical protein
MAEVSQKVTIPLQSLPAADKNGNYLIRYRVISEDQNRISHWSPIYNITPYPDGVLPVDAEIVYNGNIATVVWENVPNSSGYDIFVGYGVSPTLSYSGNTSLNTYSFIIGATAPTTVHVAVQVASSSKSLSDVLTIAELTLSLV